MLPIVCIGGGAAGVFAAIHAAKNHPDCQVILLEKSKVLLSKVKISGGGRCNVTHNQFDVKRLVQNYPRGSKALIGPFHRFQPKDTMKWFEDLGVSLKVEPDGRVFPVSNSSQTIIDTLMQALKDYKVEVRTLASVKRVEKETDHFILHLSDDTFIEAKSLLLATGSSKEGYEMAQSFSHTIVDPIPSLFTFNVPNDNLGDISGVSVEDVNIHIENTSFTQRGPLLITHFGFSGPAVLKLSAFAARWLHENNYQFTIKINWIPEYTRKELIERLIEAKEKNLPYNWISPLSKSLFAKLTPIKKLTHLSSKEIMQLAEKLQSDAYVVSGKTTNKQEFVTAGGVALDEVDFKTMQSKKEKGLFFAGEILDIDGITGGFNFQNAWTTAFIAAENM